MKKTLAAARLPNYKFEISSRTSSEISSTSAFSLVIAEQEDKQKDADNSNDINIKRIVVVHN